MATPHVPTVGRPPRMHTKHLGALASAMVFVLLIAAGVGLWQATRGEEVAAPPSEVALSAVPAPVTPVSTRTEDLAPTYYLVGSQQQAEAMRAAIAEADVLRASLGEAAQESTVLLVASAEDEAVLLILVEQAAIRDQLRLPPIRFVDLRAPVASPPPFDAAALTDAEMYQRWQQAQGAPVPSVKPRPQVETAEAAGSTLVYLVGTGAEVAALQASAPDALVVVWGT